MPAPHVNTLRYWFDVEALMYPDIPKPGKRPVFLGRYDDILPWMKPAPPPAQENRKFFVYFGLVEKHLLDAELVELFRVEPAAPTFDGNHARPSRGNTFLCAIEVAGDGRPNIASLQLAAFCAGFAQRRKGSSNDAPTSYSAITAALQAKAAAITSSAAGIADAAWFEQLSTCLVDMLDWQPRRLLAREQLCAHQVSLVDAKGKRLARPPELEPVNSFYLDDLERIRLAAEHGPLAGPVRQYLDGEARGERIDVTTLAAIDGALQPHRFPPGRWPSEFSLFTMQQVAVNTAMEALRDGGIFSVNGPPGTGKTTLLMDVIAASLVERAQLLTRFDNPEHAFARAADTVAYPANAAGAVYSGNMYLVDPALLGGGIVVASANNKAVENITLDLPNWSKVFPQPLEYGQRPFDYFAATAESILNEPPAANAGDGHEAEDDTAEEVHARLKCWGLISVPLGNKKNRNLVAARLGRFGEAGLFKELDKISPGALDWARARAAFAEAVAQVEALQHAIARYDALLPVLAAASTAREQAQADILAGTLLQQNAAAALQAVDASTAATNAALAANMQERALLTREWPWWRQAIGRLFQARIFAGFAAQRQALTESYATLTASRAGLRRARLEAQAGVDAATAALQDARAALAAARHALGQLEQQADALRAVLGEAAFDPAAFAQRDTTAQQLALPRSSQAYQAARANVFVAAMQVHKAFLKHAGKGFRANFQLALAMLEQQPFIQSHLPDMAPHLWATFFLAVPVVSSTFASVARCFRDLGEGQIGLLLVDEAGQAVPSHALGAIWRARRSLIVGDPLQVEPVIKMDQHLDAAILAYHGAPVAHMLTANSAQHLADRANQHGAVVVQYDGSDLWVGAPLRVHRRCVDPMFSLSNDIAYNNKMVLGVAPASEAALLGSRPLLGPSGWHDVVGGDFDDHFSVAEGKVAVAMVVAYARHGWIGKTDMLPDIFVVSPFKSVAEQLQAMLRRCAEKWADGVDDEGVTAWLTGHVGTVHTFQGKECESVLFVLGGRTAGARSWAGSRPNIINVAATRAKRRLYVIGNRKAWVQTVFGARLAQALPVIPSGAVQSAAAWV